MAQNFKKTKGEKKMNEVPLPPERGFPREQETVKEGGCLYIVIK